MARRWRRVALWTLVLVVALVAAAITATVGWRTLLFGPRSRPLTARTFEITPERLERGRYLAESVYGCVGCHSQRDWSAPGAPPLPGRAMAGLNWSAEGMPWLTAPNLTSDPETGLGRVSDDAIARAIREGITRDGRAMFPIMPYQRYRDISDEDLAAIVDYLRSVPPVRSELPPTKVPFPLSLLIRNAPMPVEGRVPQPDLSTPEKRGAYLVRTIECAGCHTPMRRGELMRDLELAGGTVFQGPVPAVAATNLTPDPTGIPYYDEALFVEMMRTGQVKGRVLSPIMPWFFFKSMTDEDLKAMFAYLKTLPRVRHSVNNTDPPTPCKLCGQRHGLGDHN